MTAVFDELLALEKAFWTGDSTFFRENADSECLVAFSSDMAGVMRNEDLAETAKDGNRWKTLEIDLKGALQPSGEVVMLTYEARATRANGDAYAALVSTGYIYRNARWKMMFHQQTPLEASSD